MTDDARIPDYTGRILEMIDERSHGGPRTYGFEYEFMPVDILAAGDMQIIYDFVKSQGFAGGHGLFSSPDGMGISFEPGGQIEFRSVPVAADDGEGLQDQLDRVRSVLEGMERATGFAYEGRGFVPGRGTAPLVLSGGRYVSMHERFGHSGTRGREMMKGTASIQLHAAIMSREDLVPLYSRMLELTRDEILSPGSERADIWRRTDDTRCGLVVSDLSGIDTPAELLGEFVRFTLGAADFGTGLPWGRLPGTSFRDFLEHLTTVFTDIRLNLKGITWELRTPDSVPMDGFRAIWDRFVEGIESGAR